MALKLSVAVRNAQLDAFETAVGASPKLRFYSGAAPANITDAASGTLLCEMTLPADWMADAANATKGKAGTWSGAVLAGALGGTLAGYYRLLKSDASVTHGQGSVGYAHGGAWAASTAYSVGDRRTNDGGKVYQCITAGNSASSGGPTGTNADITDGAAHWAYIGPSGDLGVDQPVLAAGQTFAVSAFDLTAGNA